MGGFGSGRTGGRPTADASRKIDLAWMIRTGHAAPGCYMSGSLAWNCNGQPRGSISYCADMTDPENSWLKLHYTRGSGEDAEDVRQEIQLAYTVPQFGGRRWWMICPYQHIRVGKLYMPTGGDRFASRKAWRLGYDIQRVAQRDKAFERLFRLQRKLGSRQGWEAGIFRPKGMWRRTFDRHFENYLELDAQCAVEMMAVVGRLGGRVFGNSG